MDRMSASLDIESFGKFQFNPCKKCENKSQNIENQTLLFLHVYLTKSNLDWMKQTVS